VLKIFSLRAWSPQQPTNSPWFEVLRMPSGCPQMSSTRLSRALAGLSNPFECPLVIVVLVLQPRSFLQTTGLGWSHFARLFSWNLGCFLFVGLLRCFSSPTAPRLCLCVQQAVTTHHSGGVAPFGFSRLIACMQLPLNVSPVSASFFGL